MFEAMQSFVLDITPEIGHQPKSVFTYIAQNPKMKEAFDSISVYAHNQEMMAAFNRVRNNLVFHYDVRESHCRKTLKALSVVAARQPSIARDNPLIRSAGLSTRFHCADLLTSISWSLSHGRYDKVSFTIPKPVTLMPDDEYYRKFCEYSGEAMGEFFNFGNTVSLLRIQDKELATGIKEHEQSD